MNPVESLLGETLRFGLAMLCLGLVLGGGVMYLGLRLLALEALARAARSMLPRIRVVPEEHTREMAAALRILDWLEFWPVWPTRKEVKANARVPSQ